MLLRLGRPLQRLYSSFNTCSSAPKGGWAGIDSALTMPKLPVFMTSSASLRNHHICCQSRGLTSQLLISQQLGATIFGAESVVALNLRRRTGILFQTCSALISADGSLGEA